MPKVSVIIPVYNTENYLRKCLDSVCNQTLKDIEIICINDCSPDGCLEILKEYASKDERIKIIDFKENKGAACARNAGIDAARGEYLGFVDSDDFIDLDFYEKLYNKAHETGADAVKGIMLCLNKDNTLNDQLTLNYFTNDLIQENIAYFYESFTTAIYKKSIILDNNVCFPPRINFFEDPFFSINLAFYIKTIQFAPNAKYYYIKRNNSLTGNCSNELYTQGINLMLNLIGILNKKQISQEHYFIVFQYIFNQLVGILEYNKPNEIFKYASIILQKIICLCKYNDFFVYYYLEKNKPNKNKILKRLKLNILNKELKDYVSNTNISVI